MLVHAGAEKNVCNTVVSTDTHQTTTNFAETMCKNRYTVPHIVQCKHDL